MSPFEEIPILTPAGTEAVAPDRLLIAQAPQGSARLIDPTNTERERPRVVVVEGGKMQGYELVDERELAMKRWARQLWADHRGARSYKLLHLSMDHIVDAHLNVLEAREKSLGWNLPHIKRRNEK